MEKNPVGLLSDIQRFSIHNGPGIRCCVFLKGCHLRCLWCHNPESVLTRPRELSFVPSRCIFCGHCFTACPRACHHGERDAHTLDWQSCARCGQCAAVCPAKALETVGREATAEAVIADVLRDAPFYEASGGGVTLSGGEPMLQREFTQAFMALAKAKGLHTALETCAVYDYAWLDGVKENVDLFLIDYKASGAEHTRFTGADNAAVWANLRRLHDEGYTQVLIRCPIVRGCNDNPAHFQRIAELTRRFPRFIGAELLPYHRLGVSKISRFGLENALPHGEFETSDPALEQQWADTVRGFGGRLIT